MFTNNDDIFEYIENNFPIRKDELIDAILEYKKFNSIYPKIDIYLLISIITIYISTIQKSKNAGMDASCALRDFCVRNKKYEFDDLFKEKINQIKDKDFSIKLDTIKNFVGLRNLKFFVIIFQEYENIFKLKNDLEKIGGKLWV